MRHTAQILLVTFLFLNACGSEPASQSTDILFRGEVSDDSAVPTDCVIDLQICGTNQNHNNVDVEVCFNAQLNAGNNYVALVGSKNDASEYGKLFPGEYNVVADSSGDNCLSLKSSTFSFTVQADLQLIVPVVLEAPVVVNVQPELADIPDAVATSVTDRTDLDTKRGTLNTTHTDFNADPPTATEADLLNDLGTVGVAHNTSTLSCKALRDEIDKGISQGADSTEIDDGEEEHELCETALLTASILMETVVQTLRGVAAASDNSDLMDALDDIDALIGDDTDPNSVISLLNAILAAINALPGSDPAAVWNVGVNVFNARSGETGADLTGLTVTVVVDSENTIVVNCDSPCRVEGLPLNETLTHTIEAPSMATVQYLDPPHLNATVNVINLNMWASPNENDVSWFAGLFLSDGTSFTLADNDPDTSDLFPGRQIQGGVPVDISDVDDCGITNGSDQVADIASDCTVITAPTRAIPGQGAACVTFFLRAPSGDMAFAGARVLDSTSYPPNCSSCVDGGGTSIDCYTGL